MKQIITLIVFGLFCQFLFAQDDFNTIFSAENMKFSGFGGWSNELSLVNGEIIANNGGGGALLINQQFFIGGYGMGSNNFSVDITENGITEATRFNFHNAGLWLGYIQDYQNALHFGFNIKMGAGSINETGRDGYTDLITVVHPEVNVEVNIFSWFKVTGGAGYRFVNDLDPLSGMENYTFRGPTASLGFYFGFFNQDCGK